MNFYESLTPGAIFPKNDAQPVEKEIPLNPLKPSETIMTQSMVERPNGPGMKMSHSRSSSHDTSLILLGDQPLKSSRSNSSLSDTSPTTGSPKMPTRRKPKAPVPPMTTPQPTKLKLEAKISLPMSVSKLHDTSSFSYIDSDPMLHVEEGQLRKAGSSDNILLKPDRPPRPVLANAECQTLSRAVVRQVPLKDKSSGLARPVAAPRTTLIRSEFEKSEENLVTMREKPAIPDRPVTLMRPASFRAATGGSSSSPTSVLTNDKLVEELSEKFSKVNRNNSFNGEAKQVTMYTVDKQKVSIVDLPPSGSPHPIRRQLFISESSSSDNKENVTGSMEMLADDAAPSSPRDVKVKRPQVPPPARPRSSEGSGDSTNL